MPSAAAVVVVAGVVAVVLSLRRRLEAEGGRVSAHNSMVLGTIDIERHTHINKIK
jgi:hypothetical protein